MPFDRILGQSAAVETLARALGKGLVHHAYRFEGPAGVGKEKCAIALGQALVCTGGDLLGCGRCDACIRAERRSEREPSVPLHPDVVLVGRQLYPYEIIGKREATEISVEQVRRVVLSRAAYPPHEGKAQLFIIRGAEELSISAANALLKTLEEPRPGTHFVLLTSQPELLLDTIRSRTLPVRFGPLPDAALAAILRARGVAEDAIASLTELAGGSAEVALDHADPEQSGARERFVLAALAAMRAPTLADAVAFGETAERDRAFLTASLRALGAVFARQARSDAAGDPAQAETCARRYALVQDAIDAIDRNGQAGLVLSTLCASLRRGRQIRPGTPPPIPVARR